MNLTSRSRLAIAVSALALLGCGRKHSDSAPAVSASQSSPEIGVEPTARATAPPATAVADAALEDAAPSPTAGHVSAGPVSPVSSAKLAPQASAPCPSVPLKNGAACKVRGECTYIDCAGAGRVTVRCNGTKASVEALPCSAYRCGGVGGIDCTGDNLCVERSSGSRDVQCAANPCGKAPLTCDCAGRLCEGAACSISGAFVRCGGGCKGCPQ